MRLFVPLLASAAPLPSLSSAAPSIVYSKQSIVNPESNGAKHTVFDHRVTNNASDYVSNSGICETTEGVKQYSGYLMVGENMHMWFW